ncbi:MAG TPA: dihydrofolate reductase family protein, partial [Nevskiaceae bacterium]|nr:dihydrofolate reductase family protein [Nevskiaceae bacterium]
GALLRAHLVDELLVYVAPSLLGSDARGLVHLPGLDRLADRVALQFTDVRRIGDDLRITAIPTVSS